MKKQPLMYDEKTTLYAFCKSKGIPYYRIAYRYMNKKPNQTLDDILYAEKRVGARVKYIIKYKGNKMSLSLALKTFFKDNNLIISTNAGHFTRYIKQGEKPQHLFDSYCKDVLRKYRI